MTDASYRSGPHLAQTICWSPRGSLARLLARHLLFSECASDGSTSALGEACALFRFNGVERYGSKSGTTAGVMYTSVLPFPGGSHRNGVVVKLRVALVQRCTMHCTRELLIIGINAGKYVNSINVFSQWPCYLLSQSPVVTGH